MNRHLYKLMYALLAATGVLLTLAAILPAQAEIASSALDEPLERVPASLSASTPLTGTQPGPRYGHTLTQVGNAIYLFGGMGSVDQQTVGMMGDLTVLDDSSVLNDLWQFSRNSNEWKRLFPQGGAPEPRYGHAACATVKEALAKLFIFSGVVGQGYAIRDQWFYDPASNAWQQIIPENEGPNGLAGHSAVADATGKPVIFGGADGSSMDTRVWRYNPETNKYWMLKEEYNDALKRRWHYMGSVMGGGRVLIFGGLGSDGKPTKDVWMFDLETRTWTQEWPPLGPFALSTDGASIRETAAVSPTARAEIAGVSYGNRFLVLGGMDESGAELDEVWEYDLLTHSWRALPPLPAPRRMAAAAILEERDDQVDVLLFGGISGGEVISDTLVYTVDVPPTYTVYLPLVMRQ